MAPSPRKKSNPTKIAQEVSASSERSRRATTKLVTAATNSAISQKPSKGLSPVPPPRPLRHKKYSPPPEPSKKVKEQDKKGRSESNKEKSVDKRKVEDEGKLKNLSGPKKRKREDENQNNKKAKTTGPEDSVRRSRRETTRISTLATLNSSTASDGEAKSRSASVEPLSQAKGKKKSPTVKIDSSPPRSRRKTTALSSLATKKALSQSQPDPEEDSSDHESQSEEESDEAVASPVVRAVARAVVRTPRAQAESSGSRRSVRSSTAINTLASNNAATQVPFVVVESEDEEDLSGEESEEQYETETVPKRGRGRPSKKATALSPNNPFAAVTREYKEQQKIVAKLNRKRKSSLSPEDRPRLLSEEENNRLFDSLFEGDSQEEESSSSRHRNAREDSPPLKRHPKKSIPKSSRGKRKEASPESTKEMTIKSVPKVEDSKSVLPSLTWAKSSTSNPSSSRIVAPWRKLGEVDKGNTEDHNDIYEFGGQGGEAGLKGKTETSPERRSVMTTKHGAYSGQLTAMTWKQKLEQSSQRSHESRRSPSRPMFGSPRRDIASPDGKKLDSTSPKGSPRHEMSFRNSSPRSESSSKIGSPRSESSQKTGSPRIDPSQRTYSPRIDPSQRMGLPKVYGSALGRFGGRVGGSYKPSSAGQTSHQLSLTSLSSDYNIVAAVDKHHSNSSGHNPLPEVTDQSQPLSQTDHNVKRKSFVLSRIFSKPPSKDQEDEDSGDQAEDATATTSDIKYEEKNEKKVNKSELEDQKRDKRRSKDKAKIQENSSKRPSRNSTKALNFKEASSESDSVDSNSSDLGGLKNNKKRKLTRTMKPERPTNTSIVCTSCQRDDINLVKQLVKKFGTLTFATNVGPNTSHVVTGEGKRTLNLLKGLLQGCWIVSKDWALASLEANRWVEEETFEMISFSPAVRKIRLERKANNGEFKSELFKDVGSVFISSQCKAPRDELRQLITSGGGELASGQAEVSISVGEAGGKKAVTEKWVLDSVQYHAVMPFSDYPLQPGPGVW